MPDSSSNSYAWRRRIRRAGSPWGLPGWLLLLIEVLDWAQRVDFIARLLKESQVLAWIQTWGWLVGLTWLGILMFVWPERPDRRVHHARNANRVQAKLVELVNRIDSLRELNREPGTLPRETSAALETRRQTLVSSAVADLVEDVLKAIPEDVRHEYEEAISYAVLALIEGEYGRGGPQAWSAASGMRLYLDRRREHSQDRQTRSWRDRLLRRQ